MPSLFVNIDVPDVEAAIRFYTTAFELRLGRRLQDSMVELLGAEVPIYLLHNPEGSAPFAHAATPRHYSRHWTPVHLDFVVTDLDVALRRAVDAGAVQESAPSEHAYGRLVLLSDPFGNGICLLQMNDLGYSAIALEG